MFRFFLVGLIFLLNVACSTSQSVVYVGDTRVVVRKMQHGAGKSFVHLHQNETTALQAARQVVMTEGGSVLTLVHPGARNIVFHLQGTRYEFDPNRMFSEKGIKKSLTMFGPYSRAAYLEVKGLANRVTRELPEGKIVAVHNNNGYSIREYLQGHSLARDASALHLSAGQFYRNFYLVTKRNEFQRLKDLRYNTVLQAHDATDDGSLSVYLAGRDYVNVEAAYGQLSAQINMLKWA